MNHDKHISYLIDYINSFSLLYMQDQLQDNTPSVYNIMDPLYKEYVLDYTLTIKQDSEIITYFVTPEYNLLWEIWRANAPVATFARFITLLDQMTKRELEHVLRIMFHLTPDVEFRPSDLNQSTLSTDAKWKLFTLLDDFDSKFFQLTAYLKQQFTTYCYCADNIYEKFTDLVKEVDRRVEAPEHLYNLLFKDSISIEDYNTINDFVVLLVSSDKVLVNYSSTYKLIALGVYVYQNALQIQAEKDFSLAKCQRICKILSDPTRYRMLSCIADGLTVNKELAEIFDVSGAGITYQMRFLAENELLVIDDITKRYKVNNEIIRLCVQQILDDIVDK